MADITNKQVVEAIGDMFTTIVNDMATQEDIKDIVKEELKGFATKDDLKMTERRLTRRIVNVDHKFENLRESFIRAAKEA